MNRELARTPTMIEMKQFRVSDRLAALQREADILHAERERDRAASAAVTTDAAATAATRGPSVRLRLGRWLVTVGESIAGPVSPCDDDSSMPHPA
jgi:hypothetical protein